MTHARKSKTVFVVLTAVITTTLIVATLLTAEYILDAREVRTFEFHNVLDPYVGFVPPRNTHWRSDAPSISSRGARHSVEYTNADGLRIRSPEHVIPKAKPEGQLRLAVIGGSTVRIGTSFDDSLPGAINRLLTTNHPHLDIEVLNAGIISAIAMQELQYLVTTLVDYELDVLLVYDGINDSGQMLYYEGRPGYPYNFSVVESAWDQFVRDQRDPLWRLLKDRSAILSTAFGRRERSSHIVEPDRLIKDPALRQEYALSHIVAWEKIRQVCNAYGIVPIFVLQPTSLYPMFQGNPDTPQVGTLYANYLVYENFRQYVRSFSDRTSTTIVLDLSNFLAMEDFYDGAHVYDEVNATIAKRLEQTIIGAVELDRR